MHRRALSRPGACAERRPLLSGPGGGWARVRLSRRSRFGGGAPAHLPRRLAAPRLQDAAAQSRGGMPLHVHARESLRHEPSVHASQEHGLDPRELPRAASWRALGGGRILLQPHGGQVVDGRARDRQHGAQARRQAGGIPRPHAHPHRLSLAEPEGLGGTEHHGGPGPGVERVALLRSPRCPAADQPHLRLSLREEAADPGAPQSRLAVLRLVHGAHLSRGQGHRRARAAGVRRPGSRLEQRGISRAAGLARRSRPLRSADGS